MKTVKMLKTVACETASGVNQVFGPKGKKFCVDDKTAKTLENLGAVETFNAEKPETAKAKSA